MSKPFLRDKLPKYFTFFCRNAQSHSKKYAKPWATNTRRLILSRFYPADLSALPSHLTLLQGHAADNLRHAVVEIRRHRILGEKQVLKAAPAALASSAICVMAVYLPNGSVIVSHLHNPQRRAEKHLRTMAFIKEG